MKKVPFPYGKTSLVGTFAEEELVGVLTSGIHHYTPSCGKDELVRRAMENPVGSLPLWKLAQGKDRVVIIASDHTRPVPSRLIIPAMLGEIRRGNPRAEVTILIATGCHRGTTRAELVDKFGADIVERERICIHDCDAREELVSLGTLPSGGQCEINRLAAQADLLVAEGFIEPHFFAGFSGGRKSVLPGVAGRSTVLANHCSEFIAHPAARTGVLEDNPIHRDMLWAAKTARLAYVVNVVLNAEKEIIYAAAGDAEAAHRAGTDFLSSLCGVDAVEADIAVTTNGGYPLDQNAYQAVKGMTAAEATVRPGGVIVMLAAANDGIGGDHFFRQLADEPDGRKTMAQFLARGRGETVPDQWQTQVLLRVLEHARVIFVSEMPEETVRALHLIPAPTLEAALELARSLVDTPHPRIVAIPDGVSVIVRK